MRTGTRYRKKRASRKKREAKVYRQSKDKQLVAVPVESLFDPERNLRGGWGRQTEVKNHYKAAKAAARKVNKSELVTYHK